MERLANIEEAKIINKNEQKTINGGRSGSLRCGVLCPSYCHCSGFFNDQCVFNEDHPRAGQYCQAL